MLCCVFWVWWGAQWYFYRINIKLFKKMVLHYWDTYIWSTHQILGFKVLQLHKNLTFWQSYKNVHLECKILGFKVLQLHKNHTFWQSYKNVHLECKILGFKVLQLHKNHTFWQNYENVHFECQIELFLDFCSSIFPKFVDFGNNILFHAFYSCWSNKNTCHLSTLVNIVAK